MKYNKYLFIVYWVLIITLLIIIVNIMIDMLYSKQKETEIPMNIFQTWSKLPLEPLMQQSVDKLMEENPEFNYYIFDDENARISIQEHFDKSVVDAYDQLIPGAYKADLWRYCILYIYGGIYLDIKLRPVNGFKLKSLTDKEYYVKDAFDHGIYNALMVCKPKNELLKTLINQIVENVKNKFYGDKPFDITGPSLMKKYFTEEEMDKLILFNRSEHITRKKTDGNEENILLIDQKIKEEIDNFHGKIGKKYYVHHWGEKTVYK